MHFCKVHLTEARVELLELNCIGFIFRFLELALVCPFIDTLRPDLIDPICDWTWTEFDLADVIAV